MTPSQKLLSQFRKGFLDPREYWGLSELLEYALCISQMLNRERALTEK
jgi:hypothetical protein